MSSPNGRTGNLRTNDKAKRRSNSIQPSITHELHTDPTALHPALFSEPLNGVPAIGSWLPTEEGTQPPFLFRSFADSALKEANDVLKEIDPLAAALAKHYATERVTPAIFNKGWVAQAEHARLEAQRSRALTNNTEIEEHLQRLNGERLMDIAPFEVELEEASERRKGCDQVAASAAGNAGLLFDPVRCEMDGLARSKSKEAAAAELHLPYGSNSRRALLTEPIWWIITIISGIIAGCSIGILMGALDPSSRSAAAGTLTACSVGGAATLVLLRKASFAIFLQVGEWLMLKQKRLFLGFAAIGVLWLILAVLTWAWIDGHGILRAASTRPGGEPMSGLIALIAGSALIFPPLIFSCVEGLLRGRENVIDNFIEAELEKQDAIEISRRREDPESVNALIALSNAKAARAEEDRIKAELARVESRYRQLTQTAESRRLAVPTKLSSEQEQEITKADRLINRAMLEHDSLVAKAMRGGQ